MYVRTFQRRDGKLGAGEQNENVRGVADSKRRPEIGGGDGILDRAEDRPDCRQRHGPCCDEDGLEGSQCQAKRRGEERLHDRVAIRASTCLYNLRIHTDHSVVYSNFQK